MLIEPQAHSEEPLVHDSRAEVEVIEVGKQEQVLVEGVGEPLVDVAAEGDIQGGSADIGVEESVTVDLIVSDIPRVKLAQLTKEDPTLAVARTLADTLSEGYQFTF